MFDSSDLIHSYTRAQAIEDGVLVDVSDVATEAGFKLPVAITRAAWAQLQRTDAVWTYPARSTKTPSYAFDIVSRARLQPPDHHRQPGLCRVGPGARRCQDDN